MLGAVRTRRSPSNAAGTSPVEPCPPGGVRHLFAERIRTALPQVVGVVHQDLRRPARSICPQQDPQVWIARKFVPGRAGRDVRPRGRRATVVRATLRTGEPPVCLARYTAPGALLVARRAHRPTSFDHVLVSASARRGPVVHTQVEAVCRRRHISTPGVSSAVEWLAASRWAAVCAAWSGPGTRLTSTARLWADVVRCARAPVGLPPPPAQEGTKGREANLSTQRPETGEEPRVPAPHVDAGRSCHHPVPAAEGAASPVRLRADAPEWSGASGTGPRSRRCAGPIAGPGGDR